MGWTLGGQNKYVQMRHNQNGIRLVTAIRSNTEAGSYSATKACGAILHTVRREAGTAAGIWTNPRASLLLRRPPTRAAQRQLAQVSPYQDSVSLSEDCKFSGIPN